MSITGLGDTLADAYSSLKPTISDLGGAQFLTDVAHAGINLPADLRTVFGSEVGGYFGGTQDDPVVVAHVKNAHPAQAKAVLAKVIHLIEQQSGEASPPGFLDSIFKPTADGFVAGIPEEALTRTTSRKLGDTDVFRKAVPDAKGAPLIVFVNLAAIQRTYGIDDSNLAKLSAFGATMRSDGTNSVTRMRLVFR